MNQAEAEAFVWERSNFYSPGAAKNLKEAHYHASSTIIQNGVGSIFIRPETAQQVRLKYESAVELHNHDFGRYRCYDDSGILLWTSPHISYIVDWMWNHGFYPKPLKRIDI